MKKDVMGTQNTFFIAFIFINVNRKIYPDNKNGPILAKA